MLFPFQHFPDCFQLYTSASTAATEVLCVHSQSNTCLKLISLIDLIKPEQFWGGHSSISLSRFALHKQFQLCACTKD